MVHPGVQHPHLRAIFMMNKPQRRRYKFSKLTNVAHSAMDWLGSVQSLLAHTLFFVLSFSLILFGIPLDKVLLVLTTVVSLEAVYMAIFIQMAVNQNTQSLEDVEEDIEEIQEDVEEIQEDVVEIQEDVEEIEKGVDEIEKDIDEIQKDVDEIEKDTDESHGPENKALVERMEERLAKLVSQIEKVKDGIK